MKSSLLVLVLLPPLIAPAALLAAQAPRRPRTEEPSEPAPDPAGETAPTDDRPAQPTGPVVKSEREWAKILTRQQYLVCRMKSTEAPFTGKYVHNHARGTYFCVCCGAELFTSQAKFESGTGWPSFWRVSEHGRVDTGPDYSAGNPRVEVTCAYCGSHLGHVFNDGPPPTGLRFCINSASLKFVKAGTTTKKKKESEKDPAKADDAKPDPAKADQAKSDEAKSDDDKAASKKDEATSKSGQANSTKPAASRKTSGPGSSKSSRSTRTRRSSTRSP